jgi:hypothetical protein
MIMNLEDGCLEKESAIHIKKKQKKQTNIQ